MGVDVSRLRKEAWFGGETLVDVGQLERVCKAVCRLEKLVLTPAGLGIARGTGFVMGDGLLMTNNHVIGTRAEAAWTTAVFKVNGTTIRIALEPNRVFITSPSGDGDVDKAHLDYTIVGCHRSPALAAVFANPIPLGLWNGDRPSQAYVIGHPAGRSKKLTLRCNDLLGWKALSLTYASETIGGCSGAPVLALQDQQLRLFGLHHAGTVLSGHGINMKAIVCDLLARNQWRDLMGWVPMDARTLYRAHFHMKRNQYGENVVHEALRASARAGHAGAEYEWGMVQLRPGGDQAEGIGFIRRSATKGRYDAVVKATLTPGFSADEVAKFWEATGRAGIDVDSPWNQRVKGCGDAVRAANCGYLWHLYNAGNTLLSCGFMEEGYGYLRKSARQGFVPAIQLARRHSEEFTLAEIGQFWKASDQEPDNGDSALGKLARLVDAVRA